MTRSYHCDPGVWELSNTKFVNPAHLNDHYKPQQDYIEVEL